MKNILLVDCNEEVTKIISAILAETAPLASQTFGEKLGLDDARMVIFKAGQSADEAVSKVSAIRKACNFKAIPIIVLTDEDDFMVTEHLISAGATESLALDAPQAACRQIIQGHLSPNREALDQEKAYLEPFIENTIGVLKKMAAVDATFREVYFADDFRIYGDISGIIGLSGNSEGTVAITFYWDLARKVIASMMRVPVEKINVEYIHDGAGELINMISGSTKKVFKGTPYHFELSLPTVIVGSGHQLGHPVGASIAALIFDVGEVSFVLQVCLKPRKNPDGNGNADQE